jgi:hypothetical protein
MCKPEHTIRNEFTLTIACPSDAHLKMNSLCMSQKVKYFILGFFEGVYLVCHQIAHIMENFF